MAPSSASAAYDRPSGGLARLAADMVAAGPAALPSHLSQALELLGSVPDDGAAVAALVADAPALTGDDGLDALVVLLARALCARAGQQPPDWVAERTSRREVVAPPSPLGESFSRRFVDQVARASLALQDGVERRLARRAQGGGRTAASPSAARPVPVRLIEGPSAVRVRRWAGALGSASAAFCARRPVRGLVRVASVAVLVAVVAVGVLGLGRPSAPSPGSASGVGGGVAADPNGAAQVTSPEPVPAGPVPDAGEESPAAALPEPAVRVARPVSLRIPAISVEAPVVIVGLELDGAMEIPSDVRTVGWYEPIADAGVVPGEPGTAVIAGHVDSRTQGRGAFWPLRELAPGDVFEVGHADGTVSVWRIESVTRLPKTEVPIGEIFTFEGPQRVALITCGGEFDRSSGSYLDNYVVIALPVSPSEVVPRPFLSLES
jgi:hypothetical protein